MKPLLIAAASAAVIVGGCTTRMAGDMGSGMAAPAQVAGMPTSAAGYVAMAQSSDMFEIESSRLALQLSRKPAIRQFAQMMIDDHTRLSGEVMAAARGASLPMPPAGMMPQHREMMQRLTSPSGADFDLVYQREQMMAHEEALMLHRTYANRGDNASLRAIAARAVPAVEMHLGQARRLGQ